MRSVLELTAMRLPHGNPGAWTTEVIHEISRKFNIAVDNLPEQLIVQLGVNGEVTSRRPGRQIAVFSPSKRMVGTISTGSTSPLSRAANYRTTFALRSAYVHRWSGLLCAAASLAFADSLTSLPSPGLSNLDGPCPDFSDLLAACPSSPGASRLPAR